MQCQERLLVCHGTGSLSAGGRHCRVLRAILHNSNATQPTSAAGCSRANRVAWPTTRLSSLRPISFRREGMGLSWQGRGTETEGLIPEREPEKRLSHPRKAAGAQSTQTRQRKVVRRINNTEHPCHVTGLERVEVKGAMGCCKAAALVGLRGR